MERILQARHLPALDRPLWRDGEPAGDRIAEGTQRVVRDCYGFIRRIALSQSLPVARKIIVRLDAGFNSGGLCYKLERDDIGYIMRLLPYSPSSHSRIWRAAKGPVASITRYATTQRADLPSAALYP